WKTSPHSRPGLPSSSSFSAGRDEPQIGRGFPSDAPSDDRADGRNFACPPARSTPPYLRNWNLGVIVRELSRLKDTRLEGAARLTCILSAGGVTMFDLEQVIRERHSTRLFLPQPVPRALVEEALVLAQHAPSNSNIQPWHMVFASGPPRDRL